MENLDIIINDIIEFLRTFIIAVKEALAGISIKFKYEKDAEEVVEGE